jgi:hypothetical protein
MKNLHLLPTDKPSSLFIDIDDKKLKICVPLGGEHMMNQHIYITSNEEIKEGDWACHKNITNDKYQIVKCNSSNKESIQEHWKKIILTTDQDLIKDGVQSIDDEFLEWFVKNPSCESVEVDRDEREVGNHLGGIATEYGDYKIIIPQEKPKQDQVERMYSEEEVKLLIDFVKDCATNWDCDNDSHKYNTPCRMCDAQKVLEQFKNK